MAFQRSHSKVWWGNNESLSLYRNSDFYSLESGHSKITGNLSNIQEVDESSKLWNSYHESPGSLRSQDSGFSDNDDSSHLRDSKRLKSNNNKIDDSPNSIKTIETPPTVIRRKIEHSPLSASRRISFSAPSSPTSLTKECDLISQINKISLVTNTPKNINSDSESKSITKDRSIKRRRVSAINRKVRKSLINENSEMNPIPIDTSQTNEYHNETVYLGVGGEDDNNNLSYKSNNISSTPVKNSILRNSESLFTAASTSTPKNFNNNNNNINTNYNLTNQNSTCDTSLYELSTNGITLPYYNEYSNPLLNGHSPPVQYWLDDIRMSYNHEVMSTLQTKSIAQEAFRNLKITTTTVAKIIRQLQTRSLILQGEFERVEKVLRSDLPGTLRDALITSEDLVESVVDFIKVLERRSVFFTECRPDKKKFEDNIEHIRLITKDLRISLHKHHYLDMEALYEDIQVLKRYLLITLRLVFEKLIRVIILNIENSKCDLMLRANLNMIATLSNIDYTGFASLNDAFLKNEAIRVFLLICLDSKFSSIRALALRALATVCSTSESIRYLEEAGGIEIVKDMLACDVQNSKKTDPERREAVSLLTQITAPWHGPDHKVIGLKDCVETIVEGLTDIVEKTSCCQTLLLCAASFNNLSRLEVTSIYSIMSNESVIKLKETVENRGPGVSIFLYEQIVSLLYNMSGNKKCHSHLANRNIINFITSIFQSQFYEKFMSRSENDAHRKTIKTILHIFSRLIHESVVGQDILENNFIPIFSKVERNLNGGSEYSRDISYLTRQLNESLSYKSFNRTSESRGSNSSNRSNSSKLNFTRHESYV